MKRDDLRRRPSLAAVVCAVALALGCATPPRTAYTFDPAPGGWEFDRHKAEGPLSSVHYTHPVHGEHLEVFEVSRPSPGTSSAEFGALAPTARTLPPLGAVAGTTRALGDDDLGGTPGYWVAQYGRDGDAQLQAAALVVPSGRRHFVVRLTSREDDVEQLQGWLRDIVLRNFRFPPPQR